MKPIPFKTQPKDTDIAYRRDIKMDLFENKKEVFVQEENNQNIPNIFKPRPSDPIPLSVSGRRNDANAIHNLIDNSTLSLKKMFNLILMAFALCAISSIFFPYLRFILEFSLWAYNWA